MSPSGSVKQKYLAFTTIFCRVFVGFLQERDDTLTPFLKVLDFFDQHTPAITIHTYYSFCTFVYCCQTHG